MLCKYTVTVNCTYCKNCKVQVCFNNNNSSYLPKVILARISIINVVC